MRNWDESNRDTTLEGVGTVPTTGPLGNATMACSVVFNPIKATTCVVFQQYNVFSKIFWKHAELRSGILERDGHAMHDEGVVTEREEFNLHLESLQRGVTD